MTRFSVRDQSSATVAAEREVIWAAITDPVLLPRLTPFLHAIDAEGDRWVWHLARLPVLGLAVAPSFTEVMTFDEPQRISFAHDDDRAHEKAAVEGSYQLTELEQGTRLAIDLTIRLDLPFPRPMRPAVETAMRGVVATMGRRFSANLTRHVGG